VECALVRHGHFDIRHAGWKGTFAGHRIRLLLPRTCDRKSDGEIRKIALHPMPVGEFFGEFVRILAALDINVDIDLTWVELVNPIRFDRDTVHKSYDKNAVRRFGRVLIIADTVFKRFSANFYGKISPRTFFLGVVRSGRYAFQWQ